MRFSLGAPPYREAVSGGYAAMRHIVPASVTQCCRSGALLAVRRLLLPVLTLCLRQGPGLKL